MLGMSSEPTLVMILDRLFLLVLGSSKLMAVPSYCLFESRLAGHLPRMAVTIFMAPISDRGFSSALSSPFPWAPLLPGPSLGSPWALGLFFPWALGSGAVITKTATGKIETAARSTDTAAKKTIQQLQKKGAVAEAQPMQQLKKKG